MKKAIILSSLLVVVMALMLWLSLRKPETAKVKKRRKPNLVMFCHPVCRSFNETVPFFGNIKPKNSIIIAPAESGRIIWTINPKVISVKSRVPLFKLGGKKLNYELNKIKLNIGAQKKTLKSLEKLLHLKQQAFKNRLITIDEILNIKEKISKLWFNIELNKEKLNLLQQETLIKAPMDGLFASDVGIGQLVSKGDKLGTLKDTKHLMIKGYVFWNKNIPLLGRTVRIGRFTGKICCVLPEKNRYGARVILVSGKNLNHYFSVGEEISGDVVIPYQSEMFIPEEATAADEEGKTFIFKVNNGKIGRIRVTLGKRMGNYIEVVQPKLKTSDKLMYNAYEYLNKDFSKRFKVPD